MAEIYRAAEAPNVRQQMAYLKGVAKNHMEKSIDQATSCIQNADIDNQGVYSQTCMNLGSAIDSAIAMNEVPSSFHLLKLLLIVKEVYRRKIEVLQPSLMLLILPIKAACRIGWFPYKDKDDLLMMAKEVGYGFSDTDKISIEPSHVHSYVSNIISRFYPKMKVEHILTSFDVKAGYGTFVADFHISQGMLPRHWRNLCLLVARMDNMDTAACIASPSNVDFLVNGSGVPKRTKSDMGKGPQLPSNITKFIKYGVNLLQVIGDFDGQYIIVVAFMNIISSPDPPQLQKYVCPISGGVDSDCDVIEMSSRISLKCPISQLRIRTPVKGHLCKHTQCFDYKYFMEINSRWPTWKCPVCKKPVCNLDIRIDLKFVKILNEMAEDVSDAIVSADGSWTVATTTETNRNTMSQNNHVPATTGNLTYEEANCTLPSSFSTLLKTSVSAIGMSAGHPSALWQSIETMDAVSPAQIQQLGDSRLQSQGPCNMVHTHPSVQQTRHHMNPVNLSATQASYSLTNPNHPSAQSQQQVRTHGATQADVDTSATKQAERTNLFPPVQLAPSATSSSHSIALAFEQLRRGGNQQHYIVPGQFQAQSTTEQAQSTALFTPSATSSQHSIALPFEQPRRGGDQQHYIAPGQFQAHVGTTEQAQSTTVFTPVQLTPSATSSSHSNAPAFEQYYTAPGQSQAGVGTSEQGQSTTLFTSVQLTPSATSSPHSIAPDFEQLKRGGEQRHYTIPGHSQPAPNVRPLSPTRLPESSGDPMPSGRMRGSLRGNERAAAQLQFLAPPRQPNRANEPWSRPTPTLPTALLMQQPPSNSENTPNVSNSGNLPQ